MNFGMQAWLRSRAHLCLTLCWAGRKPLQGVFAMSTMIDEKELKNLLKVAVAEALEEQRALVKEIVEETIEEIALRRAIYEGLQTPPAKREEVFAILEGAQ